jgi:UDPglucose 6-dehydrogenase
MTTATADGPATSGSPACAPSTTAATLRVTVVGTGYLGAVSAACLAELGHEVLGVDRDTLRIEALADGRAPFAEPGLSEVLARNIAAGRLRFGTSLAEAATFGEVHLLCVGTPQRPGPGAADLSQLDAVVDALAPWLRPGSLVVGRSTVPVGTAVRVAARLEELAPGVSEVAWNPEFLREGHAVSDSLRPDRVVVGVSSAWAEATLRRLYAPALARGVPFIATDMATAELVKSAANAFLATKISFINAMAEVCEAAGADVGTLADALGHDPRIGRRFLDAGLGFGGGCLPKDIRAFRIRAGELGVGAAVDFLREVDEINLRRRRRTVDVARTLLGGTFVGRRVGVLGAAFKPGSDDVRDSPALHVAAAIQLEGGLVRVHDPAALENARAAFPTLDYAIDVVKACEHADVVLHLTEWAEYRELDPGRLAKAVRTPRLLDARHGLDRGAWRAAGWTVHTLGAGAPGRGGER